MSSSPPNAALQRQASARTRTGRRAIPAFALYGEAGAPAGERLHVESLQSRSRLYRWEIEAHVHQGLHQLLWLCQGQATVSLDTRQQQVVGPSVLVIPPGTVHGFRFAPESDGRVLTFNARALVEGDATTSGDALSALFACPKVLRLDGHDDADRAGVLFDELLAEFESPGGAATPVALWLARALVWRLAQVARRHAEVAERGKARHNGLYTRFVVLMEAHYLAHWPVARYAERLGLSVERLNRLTRAETGHNALALVQERLTREACRRLMYIAAPVGRIGAELGFDDPAYFCRFFKRRTGVSPRRFREQVTTD